MEKKYGIMPDDDKGSASKEDKKAYWEAIEKEMEDCLDLQDLVEQLPLIQSLKKREIFNISLFLLSNKK